MAQAGHRNLWAAPPRPAKGSLLQAWGLWTPINLNKWIPKASLWRSLRRSLNLASSTRRVAHGAGVAALLSGVASGQAAGADGGLVDARRFGLVCDGATDNAAALGALAAAVVAGQVVEFAPAARPCLTSRALVARSGVTYRARPGTVTLAPTADSTADPALFAASGVSDVLVQGLGFDGGFDRADGNSTLATVYESAGVVFDAVAVSDTGGIGLMFSRVSRSGVRGSHFADVGVAYRRTGRGADQRQGVAFCCGIEARVVAAQPAAGTDIVLDGIVGAAVGDLVSGDAVATGTVVRALAQAGAEGRVTLGRATLAPLQAGARLTVSRNAGNFVTGSTFARSGLDALSFSQQVGFVADRNRCESVGGHGTGVAGACIYGASSQGVEIADNVVLDSAGNGIDLYRVGAAAVRGNEVRNSGGSGISFASGAGAAITGNTCLDNHRNGLMPEGASQAGVFLAGGRTAQTGDPAVSDVVVSGNVLGDDQAVPTQTYGVQLQPGSEAHGLSIDTSNRMSGNARGAFGGLARDGTLAGDEQRPAGR